MENQLKDVHKISSLVFAVAKHDNEGARAELASTHSTLSMTIVSPAKFISCLPPMSLVCLICLILSDCSYTEIVSMLPGSTSSYLQDKKNFRLTVTNHIVLLIHSSGPVKKLNQ